MINQLEIIKYPIYGTSYDGDAIWKIDDNSNIASIYVCNFGKLTIQYNYDVEGNTIEEETARIITKKEFYALIRKVKEKYKVNFTIK